jgi:hypothetical protein
MKSHSISCLLLGDGPLAVHTRTHEGMAESLRQGCRSPRGATPRPYRIILHQPAGTKESVAVRLTCRSWSEGHVDDDEPGANLIHATAARTGR